MIRQPENPGDIFTVFFFYTSEESCRAIARFVLVYCRRRGAMGTIYFLFLYRLKVPRNHWKHYIFVGDDALAGYCYLFFVFYIVSAEFEVREERWSHFSYTYVSVYASEINWQFRDE